MHVQVTRTTAVLTISALCISLTMHIASMLAAWRHSARLFPSSNTGSADEAPELPITLRAASLTVRKTPLMGLYADGSELMPSGHGFVYYPDRGEEGEHWFVAHYHQLHCLHTLRTAFRARDNLTAAQVGHVDHCITYLHQALLCNVDVTLEPATHTQKATNGKIVNAVTGFGVTHRCKDWGQLREFMEDNYKQWNATYKEEVRTVSPVHTTL